MASESHRTSLFDLPSAGTRSSFIDRVDPRTRIGAAVVFSLVIAAATQRGSLATALLLAAMGTTLTSLRPQIILKRLVPVNVLALVLVLLLPWTIRSAPSDAQAPLQLGSAGWHLAVMIALKANAMVLWIVVLLGTMDMMTLGHALRHLAVPDKLVHLLLLTIRYVDVLHGEYLRLRTAMKLRGFRPRISVHTYRTVGYLVGMLLVRSLDRSDRVMAAMKCRGFRGRFYLLDHFAFSRHDVWFLGAACVVLWLVALGEYA